MIWKQFGSTVLVIPISENRNNLNWSEIALTKGVANLHKNSKIKAGQVKSISIDKIDHKNKIGTISENKLIEIKMELNNIWL